MERDQGVHYSDEEQDVREAEQPEMEERSEVNDLYYFTELLKHLRTVIDHGSRVPLTGKTLIDADKCMMIIDDLEQNLPDAVQCGMQMVQEKSRIMSTAEETAIKRVTSAELRAKTVLDNARKEAEQMVVDAEDEANAIVADAQERADQLIEESEIVRQARDEARDIKNDARVEASELRLKANHDAFQLLSGVENELAEAIKVIRRHRSDLGEDVDVQ